MASRPNRPGVTAVVIHDPWVDHSDTLARRFTTARDIESLVALAPEMSAVAMAMLADDAGAGLVARTLSALGDALTVRAIELVRQRCRLPDTGWCWLAFGSEGRGEQTLVTDQDNGLVFHAADTAETRALRPIFLAFGQEVNQVLAACGVPLCEGGIMAGNADCCLSLAEWQERFVDWIFTPEPQALLNATIFFDLRPLMGNFALAATLRQHLRRQVIGADAFLRMLAQNALAAAPPLGVLRDFAARDGMIDLKKAGSRLFVDAARILGLASEYPGTVARLRQAAATGQMPAAELAATLSAFHHLQRIRLAEQDRVLAGGGIADNRVNPATLNEFDRAVLHAALKQARRLQQRLKTTYHLEF